jgi:copper transport protein
VIRRVSGTNLRAVSIAFGIFSAVGLVAIPLYVLVATADFALRSVLDVGALVPLMRASAFGRGMIDLWICFALFVGAGIAAILVDRPERPQRSVAELLAGVGAVVAAGATLLVPGLSGHAAQTSPRGWSLLFDWAHLASGSLWIGGLVGLLVLWRSLPVASRVAGLVVAVPRFSSTALVSVLVLIASGTGASLLHLPTIASLWQTSYGQAILVKIALLLLAVCLAAVNLLRVRPRLGRVEIGEAAARLLRRTVAGETLLVTGALLAAAVLSSLPPPSKALADVGGASAHVGPGPVVRVVKKGGYTFRFHVTPNKAAVPNSFSVQIAKGGKPVQGAEVVITFEMLDMEMQNLEYRLQESAPGLYSHAAPAFVMVGHWGLSFDVTPQHGSPFNVLLVDKADG